MRFLFSFSALLVMFLTPFSSAFSAEKIAVEVNGEAITEADIEDRLALEELMAGESGTAPSKERVLDMLIDEVLQTQQATKEHLTVDDADVEKTLVGFETQNHMPPGGMKAFLEEKNIPYATIQHKARVNMLWNKYVQDFLVPMVRVGEHEITDTQEGETRYQLFEIVIPVSSVEDEPRAQHKIGNIFEDLNRGKIHFRAAARQYSHAASAAQFGDVGWVKEGQLESAIRPMITQMPVDAITPPIRTKNGYAIFYLKNKHLHDPERESMKFLVQQTTIPLPQVHSGEAIQAAMMDVQKKLEGVKGCDNVVRLFQGAKQQHHETTWHAMSPALRDTLAPLHDGEPSRPVPSPDGIGVFTICKRWENEEEGKKDKKSFQVNELGNYRLNLLAERVLKDLRLSAYINRRI